MHNSKNNILQFSNYNIFFYNSKVNMILLDERMGMKYKLNPMKQEMEDGIILYNYIQHGNLWSHVTIDGVTYTNDWDLLDWDEELYEWKSGMGRWLFGERFAEEEVMDDDDDDDDDNNDDAYDDDNDDYDDDYKSEDEGSCSGDYDEDEWDEKFGIPPFLMHILL